MRARPSAQDSGECRSWLLPRLKASSASMEARRAAWSSPSWSWSTRSRKGHGWTGGSAHTHTHTHTHIKTGYINHGVDTKPWSGYKTKKDTHMHSEFGSGINSLKDLMEDVMV